MHNVLTEHSHGTQIIRGCSTLNQSIFTKSALTLSNFCWVSTSRGTSRRLEYWEGRSFSSQINWSTTCSTVKISSFCKRSSSFRPDLQILSSRRHSWRCISRRMKYTPRLRRWERPVLVAHNYKYWCNVKKPLTCSKDSQRVTLTPMFFSRLAVLESYTSRIRTGNLLRSSSEMTSLSSHKCTRTPVRISSDEKQIWPWYSSVQSLCKTPHVTFIKATIFEGTSNGHPGFGVGNFS